MLPRYVGLKGGLICANTALLVLSTMVLDVSRMQLVLWALCPHMVGTFGFAGLGDGIQLPVKTKPQGDRVN